MILIHHCTGCGHTDLEPRCRPGTRGKTLAELAAGGACTTTCVCRRHTYGPPQVAPSFTDTGRRIERLAPPGTDLHAGLTTCTCEDCKTEYARLTADG